MPDGRSKVSAAWLIGQAGFDKGYALPGSAAAISTKHTLAITNRGGATAEQVVTLARTIQDAVLARFGIALTPEPRLIFH
jgi:UDP-N-acetylmuramate dehydrogenase